MAGIESDVSVPNAGAAVVRTLTVTTLINGVPTAVQMQVMAIADEWGVPLGNTSALEALIRQELSEIQNLRAAFERWTGQATL